MSLQQSYIALDWVKDALDETLQKVQSQLQTQTPISLHAAYDSLHQVSGTLHIAQLADTLVLSEVLEKVVQAVTVGRLHLSGVQNNINQAVEFLIEELDHLQRTKNSRTALVYEHVDLLNGLLLNESSESKVSFVPDFSLLDEKFDASTQKQQQHDKLKQAYQYLLATWLKDSSSQQTLLDLTRVADLLLMNAQTRQEFALWQVGRVFQREVAKGSFTEIEMIRPLLIRLERSLVVKGNNDDSYNVLIGDLLRALDPNVIADPEASKVRQFYGMDLPASSNISSRLLDSAMQQVNAARDGLAVSRDTAAIALREAVRLLSASGWQLLAQEGQTRLQDLVTNYSTDSDVINQLNFDLNQFSEKVKQTIVLTSKSDQVSDGNVIQDARHAAVRESRTALEKIKTSLAKYHQSRGDVVTLAVVPDLLKMVSGAFTMLDLPRAAKLLSNTTAAMKSTVMKAKYVPHWKQTDLLAQLISSIEYYLDQLAGQYQDDKILELAERTLVEFKQPLKDSAPVAPGGEKLYHDETTSTIIDHIDVQDESEPVAVMITQDLDVVVQNPTEVQVVVTDNPYNDDFEQDDEIREIFIEEAEEVLETIAAYYPKWKANFADEASLKEMRRAFHTLKGSGRMVGARTVGELSWSIENLLNRVLDHSVQASKSMIALIDEVFAGVPHLIENYKHKRTCTSAENSQVASWISSANPQIYATIVEEVDSSMTDEEDELVENVVDIPIPQDVPKNTQLEDSNATLPIHLLSEQAPKIMPSDDFISYFGDDDSILEIFLEEVNEVVQELNDQFPQWAVNFENAAALKVIRRNFHTLKGSGRMIGAHAFAELAWSNERLLNGVLENSVLPSQSIVQLLGEVISILPSLIQDFSAKRAPRIELLPIIHTAWLLHSGHYISGAQIQNMMQKAVGGDADIPVLDDEQFLLEDFDALAEAFNNDDTESEPQVLVEQSSKTVSAPAVTKLEMSIDELDPQLLEIFVSEAEGYLENIRTFVNSNLSAANNTVMTSDVLLRALHTLRGSAGMTGIESVYQLAHVMEHECKRLMREHVALKDDHLDALLELDRLATLQVNLLKSGQMPSLDIASYAFIDRVEALAPKKKDVDGVDTTAEPVFTGLVTELMDIGIDDVLDAEWTLKEQLTSENALAHVEILNAQMIKLSEAVVSLPIAPLADLASILQKTYQHIVHHPALLDLEYAGLAVDLLEAHSALTRMFDELAASLQVQPVQLVIERLQHWQNQAPTQKVVLPTTPENETSTLPTNQIDAVRFIYPLDSENDAELLEVFMEEAEELVQEIDQSFSAWAAQTTNNEPLKALQRHLHTLKGGARMARVESLGDYTHELETVYERLVDDCKNTPDVLVRFLRHAQDQVAQQVDQLAQSQQSFFTPTETSTLQQYIKSRDIQVLQGYFDLIDSSRTGSSAPAVVAEAEPAKIEPLAASPAVLEPVIQKPVIAAKVEQVIDIPTLGQMQVLAEAWDEGSAPDPDVLEIFLDEAGEIVDLTSVQLAKWLKNSTQFDDPSNKKLLQDLQRNLHTFKGGARMAGVDSLGDLSHEMEFVYEDLALGKRPVTSEIAVLLNQSHDWLADSIAVLDRGERPQMPQPLIDALRLFRKDPALLAAAQAKPATASIETVAVSAGIVSAAETVSAPITFVKEITKVSSPISKAAQETIIDPSGLPPMTGAFPKSNDLDVSTSEMVRVSASMMEKMINLAGENAISRARIEMELTGFAATVDEMGTAIQKISEQLRRMDGELESQIIARHHDEVSQHDSGQYQDFDPLEMDQYSSINQLSKSLAESVSDLLDFKNTLIEKSRDSESLLLQQSRIQSELQEGLMSSRLVPFSRLVPRLQRVVRQTATELGKPVELNILNAEGELDRSVLERMVAPLEHMLRNAVDHGMESAADRNLQHKPEKGSITLSVLREGSEVIITLQDDGRGINVDAVRNKAIERGIIEASAVQTDSEIMQLIFHAGLSTAAQVTQISGRGVGMDVVQSEIRQLGGVVTVSSVAGQGTCFTLRLPLTVAVTDALRVRVGERIFAVSLSQIERIVRIGNSELENFYQSNKETYEIDGQQYRLRYLGELVGGSHTPTLYGQGQNIPSPLLLVKYEGQRFAVQVDQLIGSREEIVIKPVGVQLVSVGSISGATILGDGSVVIILDLVALARSAGSIARLRAASQADLKVSPVVVAQKQTIMVVDDSVTVRKVTTRLLERNGYQVIQAKDGVDAMSKLEEAHPDLMLLDIEMPRMDGFEVATLVRHNPRLSYLPIIMITSRTGEKHRERAYSVGVNGYMGKPFQEQILLENISDLLLESKAELVRKKTTA